MHKFTLTGPSRRLRHRCVTGGGRVRASDVCKVSMAEELHVAILVLLRCLDLHPPLLPRQACTQRKFLAYGMHLLFSADVYQLT